MFRTESIGGGWDTPGFSFRGVATPPRSTRTCRGTLAAIRSSIAAQQRNAVSCWAYPCFSRTGLPPTIIMSKAGNDGRLCPELSHSLRSGMSSRGNPHGHSHGHQLSHGSSMHGLSSHGSPATPAASDDATGYHKYSDGNCSQISAEVTEVHLSQLGSECGSNTHRRYRGMTTDSEDQRVRVYTQPGAACSVAASDTAAHKPAIERGRAHSRIHARTHTCTRTHAHTHTHTHTHTQSYPRR